MKTNDSNEYLLGTDNLLANNEYLSFIISDEKFALSIMNVKEIIEYCELTRVPMVPEFISGAINLRGAVVPVINLSKKFGLQLTPVNRRTCVIIIEAELEGENTVIGVLVDKVLEVLNIDSADIEPAPRIGSMIRTDFISGMGKVDDQFIIILAMEKVLTDEEISVLGNLQ